MRKISPVLEQQVVDAYRASPNGGRTLAKSLGIGGTTLYRVLARNGVPIREDKRHGRSVRRYALTESQELEVMARYAKGERSVRLAKRFGCCRETILAIIRRRGSVGVTGRPKRDVGKADLDRAAELAGQGLSQLLIAKELGVSQGTVSNWLRLQGICRRTPLARRRHGSWKGGRMLTPQGYVQVLLEQDDPLIEMCQSTGYVLEHRIILARALGRVLWPYETVHHINGKRDDNRPENLELRVGKHGNGMTFVCADCGSRNIRACSLAEAMN